MKVIRRTLLRTFAIVAFTCLTLGVTDRLGRADSGLDTGAGGLGNQENTESIEGTTGSGAGGSVVAPDVAPSYDRDVSPNYNTPDATPSATPNPDVAPSYNETTGSGTGGSTDTGVAPGGSTDTDMTPGYSTDSSSRDTVSDTPGSIIGGTFYPDYSDTLGAGNIRR
jgi:hypothetical protein